MQSLGDSGCTHSKQHVHSSSTNRVNSREKLYFLKLLEALAGCGQPRLRDFLPFGEVECMYSQAVAPHYTVGAT